MMIFKCINTNESTQYVNLLQYKPIDKNMDEYGWHLMKCFFMQLVDSLTADA